MVNESEKESHADNHRQESQAGGNLGNEPGIRVSFTMHTTQHRQRIKKRSGKDPEGDLRMRSSRKDSRIRGVNWLDASCNTTIVTENTRPVTEIMALLIVVSTLRAPSGPPSNKNGRD